MAWSWRSSLGWMIRRPTVRGAASSPRRLDRIRLEPLEHRLVLSGDTASAGLAALCQNPAGTVLTADTQDAALVAGIGTVAYDIVKDIAPGITAGKPIGTVSFRGMAFFTAFDPVDGAELWKSDGSEEGTVLVRDIAPGAAYSLPQNLTVVGDTLFFSADDGVHGIELWKSDATEAGTVMVMDISAGSRGSQPFNLHALGNTLFFTANTPELGFELWKSNGTSSGTVLVKDIFPGPQSATPTALTVSHGTLFFNAVAYHAGIQLWKSDGTNAGTVLVKDIDPTRSPESTIQSITDVNGTVFFAPIGPAHDGELWKSDGTEAGTVLIQSAVSLPEHTAQLNGSLFFAGINPASTHYEVWKSDGTPGGTSRLNVATDFSPTMVAYRGAAYFGVTTFDPVGGATHGSLWQTDGTADGTHVVKDIDAAGPSSSPFQLTVVGGQLYFLAQDSTHGIEVWVSDGTESGTVVQDIVPGQGSSFAADFVDVNGNLFFIATDPVHGYELWHRHLVGAPTEVVRGQPIAFTLHAQDLFGIDRAGAFTYQIDWDGDGLIDQAVSGTSPIEVDHTYPNAGNSRLVLTIRDSAGAVSAAAVHRLTVSAFAQKGHVVWIGGTPASDDVSVRSRGKSRGIEILIGKQNIGTFDQVERIVFYGQEGDDRVQFAEQADVAAVFFGGPGDDTLRGGNRDDVLVGGEGDDVLLGDNGRDVLIGGDGADQLKGEADDDLLIAGRSDYDVNESALGAILAEWASGRDYVTRVNNLMGAGGTTGLNGAAVLGPRTVHDDRVVDTLSGHSGQDWFLANLLGPAATRDIVKDARGGELTIDISAAP